MSGRRTSRPADVLPLDRFNAFTDGVFAIAITLLVLELSVPAVGGRLLPALAEQWQEFLGYLISFVFIGGIWVSHAGMTKLMRHADTLAYGIDLLMLLFVGVLPFSTNLMVTHLSGPDVEAAVIIYGVNVLLASLALSLLMFYIASERSLVVDGVADETLEAKVRQRWIVIALNVAAIALAVVAPLAAVGVYLVMTFLALALPLIHLRRRRARATGSLGPRRYALRDRVLGHHDRHFAPRSLERRSVLRLADGQISCTSNYLASPSRLPTLSTLANERADAGPWQPRGEERGGETVGLGSRHSAS